jgi:hypothetical protein
MERVGREDLPVAFKDDEPDSRISRSVLRNAATRLRYARVGRRKSHFFHRYNLRGSKAFATISS